MKLKLIPLMLLIPSISNAEISNQNKFAALAVDRNNGFAYGFAYDNPKSTIAEKKALEECNLRSKNNNCSIVLSWSGEGCGVYRSIDENVGTAYGWGIAKSRGEADIIATREAQKRSGGQNVSNFVWACNSNIKNKLNVIKNLSLTEKKTNEKTANIKTVTIGNQTWMAENLSSIQFQNGDNIFLAKNIAEYSNLVKKNITQPLAVRVNKEYYYNWYAASDSRNICPQEFRVPTENDWNILINTVSNDPQEFDTKMRSKTGWKGTPGKDIYGLNIKPMGFMDKSTGSDDKVYKVGLLGRFWTSSESTTDSSFGKNFAFFGTTSSMSNWYKDNPVTSIRCIKSL